MLIGWATDNQHHLNDVSFDAKTLKRTGQFMTNIGWPLDIDIDDVLRGTDYNRDIIKKLVAGCRINRNTKNRIPSVTEQASSAILELWVNVVQDILTDPARYDLTKTESTYGLTALDLAMICGDVQSTVQLIVAGASPNHLQRLVAMADVYRCITTKPKKKYVEQLIKENDLDVNETFTKFSISIGCDDAVPETNEFDDVDLTLLAVVSRGKDEESTSVAKMLIKKSW